MIRLLPRTLYGQTLLTLLTGIGLALLAGALIYSSARQEAVRAVGALAAAERIVNLSRLVAEAPPEWRSRLVEGSSDAIFHVTLASTRPSFAAQTSEMEATSAITNLLQQALPGRQVLVVVTATEMAMPIGPGMHRRQRLNRGRGYGHAPGYDAYGRPSDAPQATGVLMPAPLARAAMSWRGLQAAIQLNQTQWLVFATSLPDTGPAMSPRFLAALLVMASMIAGLTAWVVRRMTSPLRVLSDAAERLGRNVDAPPLPMVGSQETQRASAAFNDMQMRLRQLIENRTLMLAAISHDLRTQLTLLRLRAEGTDTAENRTRMLATIDDMEAMLSATLLFARDEAATEARKRVDVSALVASIVDDMADAGLAVSAANLRDGIVGEIKPIAVRRALTNLIENAVKYGKCARVSLLAPSDRIKIIIDDDGPGIPEDQLGRVLQPFVRLDDSRNRDTGGLGLGLAIAASIAEAHGGVLRLVNRPKHGLRAIFNLSCVTPA